jgi:hypothetical protein
VEDPDRPADPPYPGHRASATSRLSVTQKPVRWIQAQADIKAAQSRRSRNSWRGALVDVMTAHEENPSHGCKCGAKVYPCSTWKALERANRGVTRQVEDFLAMKDDERHAALYNQDHWDHNVA